MTNVITFDEFAADFNQMIAANPRQLAFEVVIDDPAPAQDLALRILQLTTPHDRHAMLRPLEDGNLLVTVFRPGELSHSVAALEEE